MTGKKIIQRQSVLKKAVLEQLRRTPIIEVSCDKVGIHRTTLYRWMRQSPTFQKEVDAALAEGRVVVSDIAESQILSLIKDKKMDAIRFWLTNNSARYANKLELSGKIATDEPLTPEQKAIVKRAVELSSFNNRNKNTNEK